MRFQLFLLTLLLILALVPSDARRRRATKAQCDSESDCEKFRGFSRVYCVDGYCQIARHERKGLFMING
ncbi:hypothetical protein L5515_006036 [Caenorhabditis briggsae]|uniref:Uncharacterized protein n=1 Tax=Caenorhabditis briggsae TaxID=6238 RepID=A0AAE9JJH4_CAEBR|nr:hypothetical protein L5515_006036 [Caenorhabditis briggsae]